MDLFYFTMQQLAPSPLGFEEGEAHTVRAYLRHWLHRHYPDDSPQLRADSWPSNSLKLAALQADVAEFYGLQLPRLSLEGLATMEEIESYLQQQLRQPAA